MKENFTFVTLTYNQQSYIIQHLESIRWQIETYGAGRQVNFILADDASVDGTVEKALQWLSENESLFSSVTILNASANNGTVVNYTRALQHVETERFKLLAGDDLYGANDVFSACESSNFSLSPVIYFAKNRVTTGQYELRHWVFREFVHEQKKDLRKTILKRMHYKNCLQAGGVIYSRSVADEGFFKAIAPYRLIEDVPMWKYILRQKTLQPTLILKPLVLYRSHSGISTGKKHSGNAQYEQELLRLMQEEGSPFAKYPRLRNPYVYWYYLKYFSKGLWYKCILCNTDKELHSFRKEMKQQEQLAQTHLNLLIERGAKWNRKHEQEGVTSD